jgi:spore germination cell wall hydrolase CwlJ-like protein
MLRTLLKIVLGLIAIAVVGYWSYKGINYKLDLLKSAEAKTLSSITASVRERQLECLAKNIYFEAGTEPFEGKAAVAQVTLNRVDSGKFPADICKVIYQKNIIYDRVLCQFSWYCEGKGGIRMKNNEAYDQSMEAAKKVLLEGFRLPSLETALYYHADYVNPKWNKERLAKIGRHIFYSDNPSAKSGKKT